MSNYSVLKQDINNNIYENQTQQITGTVLNAILNEMTASLGAGYQFAGVATVGMNPSDPDQRVFYLAGEGIYTSFGGLQVPAGKLGVLKWDNRWTLQTIDGLGGGGANLTGYVSVASTDDLPDEGQPTLGYLCGTNLYLYVGEGGDTKEGKYQDCGSFRGPEGAYIQDIEQTETSHENGGRNTIKMTLSDGRSFNAYVHNGTTSSGLFPTVEALQAAYPNPVVGQYAFVGAGFPADIYVCTTAGTWTDSGEDYDGDNVDLTNYATKAEVNQLEAKVDEKLGAEFTPELSIEQGTINTTTGVDSASSMYIRTANFIKADAIHFTITGNLVGVRGYKEDGTFVGTRSNASGNKIVHIEGAAKYRLVFAYNNFASITPADFESLGVVVKAVFYSEYAPFETAREVGIWGAVDEGTAVSGASLQVKNTSIIEHPLSVGDVILVRVDSSVISSFVLQDINGHQLASGPFYPNRDNIVKITTAPDSDYGITVGSSSVTGNGTVKISYIFDYDKTLLGRVGNLEGVVGQVAINTDILTRFNLFDVLSAETPGSTTSIEALMRTGIMKFIKIHGIPTTTKFSLTLFGILANGTKILRIVLYDTLDSYAVNYVVGSAGTPSNYIVSNNLLGDGWFEIYVDWSRLSAGEYYLDGTKTTSNKNQIFVGCYEPVEDASIATLQDSYYKKVTALQHNPFRNILGKNAKGILLSEDDAHIVILGDSIWAGVGAAEFADEKAKFLPPIMSNPNPSYWAYHFGVKNKPEWKRYDSGVFTEVGTWETALDKFNEASGVHCPDGKPYGRTRQTDSTTASVSFSWDVSAFEKMAFVHRLRYDGVAKVRVSVSAGNGAVLVKHNQLANPISGGIDGEWIEANGYEFNQLVPSASGYHNGTDSFANFMTYFKVTGDNANTITITFTRVDSESSHYMYYWGCAFWNGKTILFDNCARAGISMPGLIGHCSDDVAFRHPDILMFECPLANTVNGGTDYETIRNLFLAWLYQEGTLANGTTIHGASIAANNLESFAENGTIIPFIANYFRTYVQSDANKFVRFCPTEVGTPQDRNGEMMYDSARVVFADKGQEYVDYAKMVLNIADEREMLWYDILGGSQDTPSLCTDAIHPTALGGYIQGYLVANIILNI